MKRMIVALVIVLLALSTASVVTAQKPSLDDVEAKFGDLTRAEIEAMGYVVDPVCVDASELPPPLLDQLGIPSTAAMGFHAVNEGLFDDQVSALEPEVILLGPNDEVWGVEYEAVAETENPVVLGQQMHLLEGGHPGMEFDHYALHVWLVDNPAGQFADFNPKLACAPAALPKTGGERAAGRFNGWLLASLGLLALGAGLLLRRRRVRV